ncbi:hypothetical protein DY000_02048316 [Brassica cretica]|uniref:Uncharacterized protein n=1 Tax=Brassica cretica TaxID=69181 RepID=A0ABQ7ERU4_BRACR|nr:hypothetical protein DY000_02048316 [Brassica cretica]
MRTSASSSIVHILQGIQQKRSMSDNAMEDPKNQESLDGLRSYATCVKANKYVFYNLDKIALSLRSYSRSEFNHPRMNSSAPIESGRGWKKSKDPAFPW